LLVILRISFLFFFFFQEMCAWLRRFSGGTDAKGRRGSGIAGAHRRPGGRPRLQGTHLSHTIIYFQNYIPILPLHVKVKIVVLMSAAVQQLPAQDPDRDAPDAQPDVRAQQLVLCRVRPALPEVREG
jgi:hypothetical protein